MENVRLECKTHTMGREGFFFASVDNISKVVQFLWKSALDSYIPVLQFLTCTVSGERGESNKGTLECLCRACLINTVRYTREL